MPLNSIDLDTVEANLSITTVCCSSPIPTLRAYKQIHKFGCPVEVFGCGFILLAATEVTYLYIFGRQELQWTVEMDKISSSDERITSIHSHESTDSVSYQAWDLHIEWKAWDFGVWTCSLGGSSYVHYIDKLSLNKVKVRVSHMYHKNSWNWAQQTAQSP